MVIMGRVRYDVLVCGFCGGFGFSGFVGFGVFCFVGRYFL